MVQFMIEMKRICRPVFHVYAFNDLSNERVYILHCACSVYITLQKNIKKKKNVFSKLNQSIARDVPV